ncbi:DUF6470 family protein [Cohnella faecalis]|uniref:Uncharacterized protein n=1 Tax=Cohnella faecalis TaxID=2315694 RepID=A0A398CHZ6_9BACL|nr:DUF6470 family protein [Cohnella faecalis]RIE02060.1 hypothetical protein D3H35_14955 [Cohnella faecalis]
MNDLRLSIRQTNAQIGINTQWASQDRQAPLGEQSIRQPMAKMDIRQPMGELTIDSTAAYIGLGQGPHLQFMNSIYSQSESVLLQAIAKIVADGNRMAQITNPNNAFAEIASRAIPTSSPYQYLGDASCLNVKINYKANAPIINIEAQSPQIEYTPRSPEVQYNPGSVEIYLKQRNSIDIQVTQYDLYQ